MRVCTDNAVTGSYKSFFREQSMFDAHISNVKEIGYVVLSAEIPALLALTCCLDILVRCKMVHYHCDLFFIKDTVKACLVELVDSNRRGNVIAQHQIQISHYQLSCLDAVKTCVCSEYLLCHCHSHKN